MDTTNTAEPAAKPSLCRAGADHAALKADPAAFAALEPIGAMPSYADAGEPDTLLLANCACKSTICREVFAQSAEARTFIARAALTCWPRNLATSIAEVANEQLMGQVAA